MSHLQSLVFCLVVVLTAAKDIKIRARGEQYLSETEDLKLIIQEQNFQIEQYAKEKSSLKAKVSELSASLQRRDDQVTELSTSLSSIVSLGSNCSLKTQALQQEIEVLRGSTLALHSRCSNAGKQLEMIQLETGRYFFGNDFAVNWYEADKFCNFHGLELASIETARENDVLTKQAEQFKLAENDYYWLSGTDNGLLRRFYWASSGQELVFSAWHEGNPDNAGGNQRCIGLWNHQGIIKWDDVTCDYHYHFICEMPNICLNL